MVQILISLQPKRSARTSPRKTLSLQSGQFRFKYDFQSGYSLSGTLVGDRFGNQPHRVFNLQALTLNYRTPKGQTRIKFDTAFGQFRTDVPEVLLSGTDTATGSLFSINYRNSEVTLYDAIADQWLVTEWQPAAWQLQECSLSALGVPSRSSSTARLTPLSPLRIPA